MRRFRPRTKRPRRRPARKVAGRRRRLAVPRPMRMRAPVYSFKRTQETTITAIATNVTYGSITFNLQSLPSYTDFTALYDQYRILGIRAMFVPRTTANAQGANERGTFHSVIDYDDNQAPAAVYPLLEYQSHKRTPNTVIHKRYWKPTVLVPAFLASGTTGTSFGYSPKAGQWLDMAMPNIPHYGIKFAIENNDDQPMNYDCFYTFYCQFRCVR